MNRHLTEQELLGAAFELDDGETLRAHRAHLAGCSECRKSAETLKSRIGQIELLREDVQAPEPLVARTLAAVQPAAKGNLILWPRAVGLLASAAAVTLIVFWQPWKKPLPAQPEAEWTATATAVPQATPTGSAVVVPTASAEPVAAKESVLADHASAELPPVAASPKKAAPPMPGPVRVDSPVARGGGTAASRPEPVKARAHPTVLGGNEPPSAPVQPAVAPAAAPEPQRASVSLPAAAPVVPRSAVAKPGRTDEVARTVTGSIQDAAGDSVAADAVAFNLFAGGAAPMERASTPPSTGTVLRIRIPDGNRIVNETPVPGVTVRLVRVGAHVEIVAQNTGTGAVTLSLLAPDTGKALHTFSIGASATATNRLDLPVHAPDR